MNSSQPLPWKFILTTLIRFTPLWCGVMLFCGALGFAYSIVKPDIWEASQPLIVREEASGSDVRLGRFSSQTDLQAAQETVLEMARNREVVTRALTELGPYSTFTGRGWPSRTDVDEIAGRWISVRAPETSEFGKTEVIYLATKAETPKRAEEFCDLLFTALSDHLREVRRLRADSVIVELQHACELAKANLNRASEQLTKLESTVGTDLGELRGLSESLSGDGGVSLIRSELEKEIRAAELEFRKVEALQQLLQRSQDDTNHLLVSDADLLQTQPTLQKLKTGLIDAQLEASKLAGRVTLTHPKMMAAIRSQETIRNELRTEIGNVLRTMEPALELARRKLQTLRDREADLSQKLASLAKIRTEYSTLVAEVQNRTEILNETQAALTEAEALRSAAMNTNLLSALGPPKAGEDPVGMGTVQLTIGSLAAGLLLGLGGVFLVAPNPNGQKFGRRQSDTLGGRRAEDHLYTGNSGQRNYAAPATDRRAVNRLTGERNHNPAPAPADSPQVSNKTVAEQAPVASAALQLGGRESANSKSTSRGDNENLKQGPPMGLSENPGDSNQTGSTERSSAVAEAIAAARRTPKSQAQNWPTKSPRANDDDGNSTAAEIDKNDGSHYGRVQIVEPRKNRTTDSESGTIVWDGTPESTPPGTSRDNGDEENATAMRDDVEDGTLGLNPELIEDLRKAAQKSSTPLPSSKVHRASR